MAGRVSTISTTSPPSFKPHVDSIQSPDYTDPLLSSTMVSGNGQLRLPPRTSSLITYSVPNHYEDNLYVHPDELFTQFTVGEVKSVQKQLRADADAKQEELRLMVGERYRDLLQASTSIISIARSSKHVIEALEETKDTILAQEEPPLPKRASLVSKEDAHLHTLQLLSAHIKLLLDAPEHLWRLIERKKYFQAAWLFLLARVVHRALVRDDKEDEENWAHQGIDVVEQFPLVQRQWDAVSHFRTQIVHKATLSLRSYTATSEDTCATLLTLHLLDSRPLTETLSVLLAQRSKTLHTLLGKHIESLPPMDSHRAVPNGPLTNGRSPEHKAEIKSSKRRIREVRQSIEVALDTIARTLKTARDIFQTTLPSRRSMISGVLEYIHSDTTPNAAAVNALPTELLLTTQTLLTALPSSPHFLLLPPNLRSYKPYVDLSSSSIPQGCIVQKLDEWFIQTSKKLRGTMGDWFSELESVQDVWCIRSWMRKWVAATSKLEAYEQSHLKSLLDDLSRQRMVVIWKAVLAGAANDFQDKLESSISGLMKGPDANTIDSSPVEHLFAAAPLPTLSQGGSDSLVGLPFQKYKSALQRQIGGRTALLDDILSPLESRAKALQRDFSQAANEDDEDTRILADQLREAYRPDAEALCSRIINVLDSAAESYIDSAGNVMNGLTFIGRVAAELSSSSTFLSTISCGPSAIQDFRTKTATLDARITDRWRKYTVSRVATDYWISWRTVCQGADSELPSSKCPSTALVRSLLSLSTSIQHIGSSRDPSRLGHAANDTLRLFVIELLRDAEDQPTKWRLHERQALWDLAFLRKLANLWADGWAKTSGLLDEKMTKIRGKLRPEDMASIHDGITEYFSRTQVLLAVLAPLPPISVVPLSKDSHEKLATLLPHGIPTSETQFLPALELAKPSSRFGLLLVDTMDH